MTQFTLHIKLKSAAAPGSGEGRAGVIDRETVHDDSGLPLLPARRLKGLLREAGLEAWEALAVHPAHKAWRDMNLVPPEELFGQPGQPYPGPFDLNDGRLEGYLELRSWLWEAKNWNGGNAYFHAEAVLRSFTEQRAQTAMDTETGGPKKNALRTTRVLRPGLVFQAEGTIRTPDGAEAGWNKRALLTLHLACGCLRRMGLSRNRGTGRLEVELLSDRAVEWNEEWLVEQLAARKKG
jgi:CRISPR-associated protein Csx10